MLAAFVLSQLAALPDALLALWLMLLGQGVLENRPGLVRAGGHRPRRVGHGDVVPPDGQHPGAAALPRQGHDRARIARRPAPGVGRDHRAPRAPRLPRPPLDAAQSGVRARSHVHVAVLDVRVDPAARGDGGAARLDSSGAGAARRLRAAHRAHVNVAACRRTRRSRACRAGQPPGAPPVHDRDHGATREGSAGHGHRQSADDPTPRGVGAAGTRRWRRRGGARRCGTRSHGRCSACAYVGAVVFVSSGLGSPAAEVLLVLAAGSRLSAYIGATVGEIGFLRGFWMDGSRRLAWLEDYAAHL